MAHPPSPFLCRKNPPWGDRSAGGLRAPPETSGEEHRGERSRRLPATAAESGSCAGRTFRLPREPAPPLQCCHLEHSDADPLGLTF